MFSQRCGDEKGKAVSANPDYFLLLIRGSAVSACEIILQRRDLQ